MSNQQKVNILEVLGLLGKQQPETKTSRALEKVPKHCQDLFKNGLMPVPEFQTVERPTRQPVDPTVHSRHPKRELKPGYRWKFNGTGAFGRKLFIQVPIEDPVADQIQRAESQAQDMVEEYFNHAAKEDRITHLGGHPVDMPKYFVAKDRQKESTDIGRFKDSGRIVSIEPLSPEPPYVLLTFHLYYGFADDNGWATGLVRDSKSLLEDITILKSSLDNATWFDPSVSYVKHGATVTLFVPIETFRWLDGWLLGFDNSSRYGKDVFVTDDLMRLIKNRKK